MIPFIKMNGAGNDFVIFDARAQPITLSADQLLSIADRKNDITKGCDQIIVMEQSPQADVFMRIYNADGSEVNACGNATRCVAEILEKELNRLPVTIRTKADLLKGIKKAVHDNEEYILVDMGKPKLDWQEIPLIHSLEKSAILVREKSGWNTEPSFVSMGNPHVIFFSELKSRDATGTLLSQNMAAELDNVGPILENAKNIFPEGVNVSVASLSSGNLDTHVLHASVWERGAGRTKACGTAACAMLVAANRRDTSVRDAKVWFDGSKSFLKVAIDESGHVLLGGPIETEFSSEIQL